MFLFLPNSFLNITSRELSVNVIKEELKISGVTWTVDDDLQDLPNADFTAIQDAINAADNGDIILVYPGVYSENINVNKRVNIESICMAISNNSINAIMMTANFEELGLDIGLSILKELFGLFFRKIIQNNVGEGSNSVIQSLLKLCGPKTELSEEKKIRAVVIVRNQPELLNKVQIERNISFYFILKNLISPELASLMSRGCTLEKE